MEDLCVQICRLREGDRDIPLPSYASSDAAGADLFAAVPKSIILQPGAIALIPTGLAVAVPRGYEAQIRPRSGLAVKGITVINAPGTIDADYRGEIQIALVNHGREPYEIRRGDRIAQMILTKVWQARFEVTSSLPHTTRGQGGFGHTGR